MQKQNPTAAILIIGNEILSGRTLDTNANYIAKQLTQMGIVLQEVRIIPDNQERIIECINTLRSAVDYVFTTGGIGPTHDDITTDCVAKAFMVPVILDPEAHQRLEHHYGKEQLNEARLKMAHIPQGAKLIDNPISAAPGYFVDNVFVLAGVPKIMQAMMDFIVPLLVRGKPIESRTVEAMVTEGRIASRLSEVQKEFPTVDIGSYPFIQNGFLGTALVARSTDVSQLEDAYEALKKMTQQFEKEI